MATKPESAFDQYFQSESNSRDHQAYSGKKNLNVLSPEFSSLLARIRDALNEALRNEKTVTEHVSHPPFYFDYIDSTIPNAIAFRLGDCSFIGITMPLVELLWDICVRLSRSDAIAALLLRTPFTPEQRDLIHPVLFYTQLTFVVSHEYTHHVHGHVLRRTPGSEFYDEIVDRSGEGNLEAQAQEIDADGYAVYHVLAHLIEGDRRTQTVTILKVEEECLRVQDEVLFSSFIIAIGAFLFARPPAPIDASGIYKLTHPPQAARMDRIMQNAISWCQQNKPDLEVWLTRDRFQGLMRAAAVATWGINGGNDWNAQTEFLRSNAGYEYLGKLDAHVKAHIASLYG